MKKYMEQLKKEDYEEIETTNQLKKENYEEIEATKQLEKEDYEQNFSNQWQYMRKPHSWRKKKKVRE